MKIRKITAALLGMTLLFTACTNPQTGPADTKESAEAEGLRIENGAAQPILQWSSYREEDYSNEGSDIIRYCVYVETDNDTDNDGLADLVKVFAQVPRAAVEGKYKAASIYDPTPYEAGYDENIFSDNLYEEEEFDYKTLYKECEKRTLASAATTLEAAAEADSEEWNYFYNGMENIGYYDAGLYDYFLVRGFAVILASGIGTYGSEGFELCGMDLERDSHKCVVEWLAGNRKAYTDISQNIEIKADWSNGNVAMAGCSYGGTIPFEVAVTGVEGLKTIVPSAGIASWYDYTNSQGIPTRFDVNYTDMLAANNCAGVFTDVDWTQLKPGYGSYLWQVSEDEKKTNGDYDVIWNVKDYSHDYEKINCSALIVQGLNDYNVTSRHADLMMQSFAKAGKTAKLVLHQEGHIILDGHYVNGELWDEILNKWFCHYLYGVENGIGDMACVTVQSNVDGSWKTYDEWRDFSYWDVPVLSENGTEAAKTEDPLVSSAGIAEFFSEYYYTGDEQVSAQELYYTSLDGDKSARYILDLPENTTIYGVPEIHARLLTDAEDRDGLMISAILVDYMDDGEEFFAFAPSPDSGDIINTQLIGEYDDGGEDEGLIVQAAQVPTTAKVVTYGWTDLRNPGCGPDSAEYVFQPSGLTDGEYYDYTFYMLPTVYTLAPGHRLALVLTTWDPYRAFLDEEYMLNPERDAVYSYYTYEYMVDNKSLKAMIPVK